MRGHAGFIGLACAGGRRRRSIYLRSFQDDNGDGIGDLAGIRRRLPYLVALGVWSRSISGRSRPA
jgi:hypothetical protein